MKSNDDMLIGNCVEGYTVAEMAGWQLRTDALWQSQIADTERFIRHMADELRRSIP